MQVGQRQLVREMDERVCDAHILSHDSSSVTSACSCTHPEVYVYHHCMRAGARTVFSGTCVDGSSEGVVSDIVSQSTQNIRTHRHSQGHTQAHTHTLEVAGHFR